MAILHGDELGWGQLLEIIGDKAQTEFGRECCLAKVPNMTKLDILHRWSKTGPLAELAGLGYRLPIGEVPQLDAILRRAELGQLLEGTELQDVLALLTAVERILVFCNDFAEKCPPLLEFKSSLYGLPKLVKSITKAIGPDGQLNDDASTELGQVRRQKRNLRSKIEEKIKRVLLDNEVEPYVQDDYFTVRGDRYVIPMRLDGRGRVKGSILDTSGGGQTLFIEPTSIAPMNEQLQELELSEKLEVLRILTQLTAQVASELDILRTNQEKVFELDVLSAEATYAASIEGKPVHLVEEPCLDLRFARHPLVTQPDGSPVVANSIQLDSSQTILVISGPNAGGKTVVLKTVGLLHQMAAAGLLLPADGESRLFLFDNVYVEVGDSQNLSANLSTFSGHLMGLKPALETAGSRDLVLLDELAVGTEPETGAAIAQAVLEHFAAHEVTGVITTHYDRLKTLALDQDPFRNGSMEYEVAEMKPTYRLILDVPGQSYGLELATKIGIHSRVIARAQELKGTEVSQLDMAVSELMSQKILARKEQEEFRRKQREAEHQKARWKEESEQLKTRRDKMAEKLKARFDADLSEKKSEVDRLVKNLRQLTKRLEKLGIDVPEKEQLLEARRQSGAALSSMDRSLNKLQSEMVPKEDLPGKSVPREQLSVGSQVWIVPLKKSGKVTRIDTTGPIEIDLAGFKTRLDLRDLRLLPDGEPSSKKSPSKRTDKRQTKGTQASEKVLLQTTTNTIDLRGKDLETASTECLRFIDGAMLRGEQGVVLVHGHGTSVLKNQLRQLLRETQEYDLSFRSGERDEGGDGVTIVLFA